MEESKHGVIEVGCEGELVARIITGDPGERWCWAVVSTDRGKILSNGQASNARSARRKALRSMKNLDAILDEPGARML